MHLISKLHRPFGTQDPLPGGFKNDDVVYSLIDRLWKDESIKIGNKGIVKGPSTDLSLAHHDKRVSVVFGDTGMFRFDDIPKVRARLQEPTCLSQNTWNYTFLPKYKSISVSFILS